MYQVKHKFIKLHRKILECGFNLLDGTGISKIPGVWQIFSRLLSLAGGKIVRRVDGQKFCVVNTPQKSVLHYGDNYEPHITSIFCSMLEEGMTVVDVGASLGYYTLLAAKRVGDSGLVVAFEPETCRFKGLEENIRINGWNNIKPFQYVVSDSHERRKKRKFDLLLEEDNTNIKWIYLDLFLPTIGVNDVDLIKIAVEGAELEVLRGMGRIIEKGKAKIICEVHPAQLSSLGYEIKEIEDFLKQYNYNIYLIDEKELISPTIHFSDEISHYLFTKEEILLQNNRC